jgi:putative transposase
MRYPASEKLEIIRLVEESALPVRWTLEKIGIPRATFYRWYDLYQAGGPEALDDRHPKPDRVWNRIPDDVRERIIKLALTPKAILSRRLRSIGTSKAHGLIARPAFIVMKVSDICWESHVCAATHNLARSFVNYG